MGSQDDWELWELRESQCKHWGIEPGQYLVRYDQSTGDLFLKRPDRREKVPRRINIYSDLYELNEEQKEARERLLKKKYPSKGGGYANHHIIPHDLCKKSDLVIQAERYGVFNKDGPENLMPLPDDFHKKHHAKGSNYYNTLRAFLEGQWQDLLQAGLDTDPDEIQQILLEIVKITKEKLEEMMEMPGSTIKDFF
ncbi:MAG: AHH domain-containing protein [Oscillatoria sp. Prado101]|jgi:hypothetical protein|nr:AHH domain-containing protein [Oscillatoria sp. Prado101]